MPLASRIHDPNPALYNLGLVRFDRASNTEAARRLLTADRGQAIARQADDAIRQANEARRRRVQKMVAAAWRGTRKG
jgi:hypothetical protein